MPRITLETATRRSIRTAAQRRRRRALAIAAGAIGVTLVLTGTAWAVFSAVNGNSHAGAGAALTSPVASASVAATSTVETSAIAGSADTSGSAGTTSSAEATRSGPATLTIAAVGDMIFDRRVATLMSRRGSKAPLARVAKRLASADLTIGNLESSLSDLDSDEASKDVTFLGNPRAVDALTAAGFDFLSVANNHVLDYGSDALADSLSRLDDAGIAHAGAGKNQAAAWKPAVVETGNTTTAYLAFSFVVPAGFMAQRHRAGLASGRWDVGLVEKAIRKAKRSHDYVIVSFHWGVEYEDNANAEQIRVAHRAVNAGADMVLAHHPHVIQGVELYKRGLIAYSLGDFVFDHYSRKTGESFILNARLGPHGVSDVTVTPTYLDTYGRPAVVRGSAAKTILSRLKRISRPHHTTVTIDGDTASVTR